ncbi:hypothetical protein DAI22_03g261200 [Oryza sativa Japonica Group]|nr:hypothetical protein DAI22_03g261200 [Oryza sativa Japonica Group]
MRRKGRYQEDSCRRLILLCSSHRRNHFGSSASLRQQCGGSSSNHNGQVVSSVQLNLSKGVLESSSSSSVQWSSLYFVIDIRACVPLFFFFFGLEEDACVFFR